MSNEQRGYDKEGYECEGFCDIYGAPLCVCTRSDKQGGESSVVQRPTP